jgi:hypothetical protein
MGYYLTRILSVCILIALLISIRYFIKLYPSLSRAMRCFGFFMVANFLTEGASFVLARLGISNWFVLHFYVPAKLLFLGCFFIPFFVWNKRSWGPQLQAFILFLFGLTILNSLFLQPLETFNSNAYILMTVVVILLCAQAFFRLTDAKGLDHSLQTFARTILPFLFIYECTTLFIFMFGSYLQKMDISEQRHLWVANAVLNFILQIAVIKAWRKQYLQQTTP